MKKIAQIVSLVFVFTLSTQAQKRAKYGRSDLTVDQRATLAVKKMTLILDLSDRQQKQLKSVFSNQISDKTATRNKMMTIKQSGKKPTDDERFAMTNNNLDKQIAFKKSIKKILDKEQFESFEKMAKKRSGKMKMRKMKMMKKTKAAQKEN